MVKQLAKASKTPLAGDDAAKAHIVKLTDIPWNELAFDHAMILQDYLDYKNGHQDMLMVIPEIH